MNRTATILGLSLLLLSGCSTIKDKATQKITILAPGTGGTLCFLERPGFRERIWTPKTVDITKSKDTINFTCIAPGNREERFAVKPTVNKSVYGNVATLGLGALYDYQTGAMFEYPDKVIVDFSGVKPTTQPLPEYQQLLADNPDLAGVEEFRPGNAMLMRDTGAAQRLQPRTGNDQQSQAEDVEGEQHGNAPPPAPRNGVNTSQPPLALVPPLDK